MIRERRRNFQRVDQVPFAPVIGQCELVQADSLKHAYLLDLGFEEIDRCAPDCVLLRQPRIFAVTMPEVGL